MALSSEYWKDLVSKREGESGEWRFYARVDPDEGSDAGELCIHPQLKFNFWAEGVWSLEPRMNTRGKKTISISININDCVQVELTDRGFNIYKYNAQREISAGQLDGRRYRVQLHDLMREFGEYLRVGSDNCFVDNKITLEKVTERIVL